MPLFALTIFTTVLLFSSEFFRRLITYSAAEIAISPLITADIFIIIIMQ